MIQASFSAFPRVSNTVSPRSEVTTRPSIKSFGQCVLLPRARSIVAIASRIRAQSGTIAGQAEISQNRYTLLTNPLLHWCLLSARS